MSSVAPISSTSDSATSASTRPLRIPTCVRQRRGALLQRGRRVHARRPKCWHETEQQSRHRGHR
jgi:hypothetical protein